MADGGGSIGVRKATGHIRQEADLGVITEGMIANARALDRLAYGNEFFWQVTIHGRLIIGLLSHYVIGYDISSPYNQAVSGYLPSRQEKLWHNPLDVVKRVKSVKSVKTIKSKLKLRGSLLLLSLLLLLF